MIFKEITAKEANAFLLPRHYSGRKPSISKAYGWYSELDGNLKAVCTFGKPASPSLCVGICGKEYSPNVYELNRLCRVEESLPPLSKFVAMCLRELKKMNWIIVSYSDTQMNHHGYIYQACNFMYTGATKQRTDMYTPSGKHSRHYKQEQQTGLRKVRSAKHRYVYFCTNDKKLKKAWRQNLKYEEQKYPKGDNSNYTLGCYIQDVLIADKRLKEQS